MGNGDYIAGYNSFAKTCCFFGVRIDDLFSVNYDDELVRIDYILAHEKLTDKCFLYAKRALDSILCANENNVPAIKRKNILIYRSKYCNKAKTVI